MKRIVQMSLIISVLLLSLTACGAAQEMAAEAPLMEMGGYAEDSMRSASIEAMEPVYDESEHSISGNAATVERIVIRNANMSIVVADPASVAQQISDFAAKYGGYVVSSEIYKSSYGPTDIEVTRGSVAIRVLSENLDQALDDIKALAIEIENENVSGEDVTDRYTDLNSRLRNLEAAEEQLLDIMDNATETEDVIYIFNNIREVREEIEVLRGQINYLEESARLSHIYVSLIPDEVAQPLQIGSWRPSGTAKRAVESLIGALQFIGDTLIWLVICIAPVVIILGFPAYFVIRAINRKRRAKKADKEIETPAQE